MPSIDDALFHVLYEAAKRLEWYAVKCGCGNCADCQTTLALVNDITNVAKEKHRLNAEKEGSSWTKRSTT
jgi:hypothetical protein